MITRRGSRIPPRRVTPRARRTVTRAPQDFRLRTSMRTQIAFAEILQEDMSALRDRVTALEGREDVQPTVFDEIGQTLLVWTISLAVGAVIGGPTLAYLQHATLSSKLAEGAISGVAGGIASEVVRLINRPAR